MNQSFEDLTQHVVQSPAAVGLAAVKSAMTWTNATVICIAMYLVTCSLLRFRHEKAMRLKFNYPDRASLARMTNDDAQSILEYIMTYEFPFLYKLALQFAIFKVKLAPRNHLSMPRLANQFSYGIDLRLPHHVASDSGNQFLCRPCNCA